MISLYTKIIFFSVLKHNRNHQHNTEQTDVRIFYCRADTFKYSYFPCDRVVNSKTLERTRGTAAVNKLFM